MEKAPTFSQKESENAENLEDESSMAGYHMGEIPV